MQSRIVVNSQEESLLSTHKVLRNTYFLIGINDGIFGSCCLYFVSLNLPYPTLSCYLWAFTVYFL